MGVNSYESVKMETFPYDKKPDWAKVFDFINNNRDYTFRTTINGGTLLHFASRRGNDDVDDCDEKATENVEMILKFAMESGRSAQQVMEFVNIMDEQNNTALHLAVQHQNKDVVELLLEHGADVNLPKDGYNQQAIVLIFDRVHRALTTLYDKHIKVIKKKGGRSNNDLAWEFEFDFRAITGVQTEEEKAKKGKATSTEMIEMKDNEEGKSESEKKREEQWKQLFEDTTEIQAEENSSDEVENTSQVENILTAKTSQDLKGTTATNGAKKDDDDVDEDWQILRQTKMLATVLRQRDKFVTNEILSHPLVQVFLYFKLKKFKRLIWASVGLHLLWYVVCIYTFRQAYVMNQGKSTEKSGTHPSENTDSFLKGTGERTCFLVLVLVWLFKEVHEFSHRPSTPFYIKQVENVAQLLLTIVLMPWLLVVIFFFRVGNPTVPSISILGIFMTTLLIQSQLTKVKWAAKYTEMLAKGIKSLLRFVVVFSPILISFLITLNLLLPGNPEFDFFTADLPVKVLVMMTGEINYKEVFHEQCDPEEKSDSCVVVPEPIITKLLFGCFVILVVIMLQNMLIGLTVSDIKGLEEKAQQKYIASQLELIYLIEAFVMGESVVMDLCPRVRTWWSKHKMGYLVTRKDIKRNKEKRFMRLSEYPREMQDMLRELGQKYN